MTTLPTTAATRRLVDFYENLAAADVARLGDLYAPEAYFRDPFNEVRGVEAIQRIFGAMFEQLADCRFRIVDTVVDERGATAHLGLHVPHPPLPAAGRAVHPRREPPALRRDGLVVHHRDYWDAADELYAKLPLIGPVMRFLKRRLG